MNGITRTRHFDHRLQQRGLNNVVVMALLQYGECRSSRHGVESLIFTKSALSDIENDFGPTVGKMCERLRNTYLIVRDGVLITVARSYRTVH